MIAARVAGATALVARLTEAARRIAAAQAEARRAGAHRWRRARVLWPLFGRER